VHDKNRQCALCPQSTYMESANTSTSSVMVFSDTSTSCLNCPVGKAAAGRGTVQFGTAAASAVAEVCSVCDQGYYSAN